MKCKYCRYSNPEENYHCSAPSANERWEACEIALQRMCEMSKLDIKTRNTSVNKNYSKTIVKGDKKYGKTTKH